MNLDFILPRNYQRSYTNCYNFNVYVFLQYENETRVLYKCTFQLLDIFFSFLCFIFFFKQALAIACKLAKSIRNQLSASFLNTFHKIFTYSTNVSSLSKCNLCLFSICLRFSNSFCVKIFRTTNTARN